MIRNRAAEAVSREHFIQGLAREFLLAGAGSVGYAVAIEQAQAFVMLCEERLAPLEAAEAEGLDVRDTEPPTSDQTASAPE